jgi:hypothetical protein
MLDFPREKGCFRVYPGKNMWFHQDMLYFLDLLLMCVCVFAQLVWFTRLAVGFLGRIYIYIHICILYACMHACMCACAHVCMSACVYVCMSLSVCMSVCLYVCMFVYCSHPEKHRIHIYIFPTSSHYCDNSWKFHILSTSGRLYGHSTPNKIEKVQSNQNSDKWMCYPFSG